MAKHRSDNPQPPPTAQTAAAAAAADGSNAKHAYGNFTDPVGLAWRMLRTGKREAVWPLTQAAAGLLAKPVDWLLSHYEPRTTADVDASSLPLILLTGPPRSGTTLAAQLLARYLHCSYFPNVSEIFPHAPVLATRYWMRDFRPPRSSSLRSFYGNTSGLRGINDGFHIWNRWLGHDRYRVARDLDADARRSMQNFFAAWQATFRLPFLNKNNRNVDGIGLLSDILPHSVFVVVTRDSLAVVQSIVRAREFVQGDRRLGWGLYAGKPTASGDSMAYLDDVCRQVVQAEKCLAEQLQGLAGNRFVRCDYTSLCQHPRAFIRQVADLASGTCVREALLETEPVELQAATRIQLSETEQRRVAQTLASLRRETSTTGS